MSEGNQGVAELFNPAQTGYFHHGEIQAGHSPGRTQLLSRSFERHFNERPYLHHTCYLFLTKTTKERSRQQSNWNTLCRGFLVPKEIRDKETVERFMEAVGQFESIVNDSGLVRLERLTTEEITGTEERTGHYRTVPYPLGRRNDHVAGHATESGRNAYR